MNKSKVPYDENGNERECFKCHKLIYNKREGCPECANLKQSKEVSTESFNLPSGKLHTPTPWMTKGDGSIYKNNGIFEGLEEIANGLSKENAAFIVKAVNSYDELLTENKKLINVLAHIRANPDLAKDQYYIDQIEELIYNREPKAEGKI